MRLINGGKLEEVFSGPFCQTYKDCRMALWNAPIIDAIPVEWLLEKIKEHTDDEGWQDYLANSFGLCIEEWQKEQEART